MTTPLAIDNAPGQDALTGRVGRYGDFRDAMLARLADPASPFAPLNALRVRSTDDPTIALIDAFAAACDVLTFYQERLLNEGYLRTALDAKSVHEIVRLVGYRPRAGVAASTFLSFTADPAASVILAAGARAQSVPGAGQTAQSFETDTDLQVDGSWNSLRPRLTRPTQPTADLARLFLSGTTTGLKANDPLLLILQGTPSLRRVAAVTAQPDRQRTLVSLQPVMPAKPIADPDGTDPPISVTSVPAPDDPGTQILKETSRLAALIQPAPAVGPTNSASLLRSSSSLLAPTSDAALALAAGATIAERRRVFEALAVTPLAAAPRLEVHAFRTVTAPAGSRSPPRSIGASGQLLSPPQEWTLTTPVFGTPSAFSISITVERQGSDSPSMMLKEARADPDRSARETITSVLRFQGAEQTLTIDPTVSNTTSGALGEAGTVTCTLVHRSATELVLSYLFSQPSVSLLVSGTTGTPPMVVDQSLTPATTNLSVSEPNNEITAMFVQGMLALETGTTSTEDPTILNLDGVFETITPGSWVAFDAPNDPKATPVPAALQVADRGVSVVSRTAYGQTARLTRLVLTGDWIDPKNTSFTRAIRDTAVFAGSMPLTLADEDVTAALPDPATPNMLELDSFVPGLPTGRWLIITGERTDVPGSVSTEIAMLAGSQHIGDLGAPAQGAAPGFLAGETLHTVLSFAEPLAFSYKRETVSVLANVAKATQGESIDEILGSGSGAVANQSFTLKKAPLTFVSAATSSGSTSTLKIYVNGVRWSEVATFNDQSSTAQIFTTHATPDGLVTVRFGDGIHGARLPSGADNVRARYRAGLGTSGNLDAGTISSLYSRPLGLKSVTNPLASSGGADAEGSATIRRAAPSGLVSLSRLVALRDYEDFTAAFAGIGKVAVKRFAGPDGPLVHLTIAGANDDALDQTSDVWTALGAALESLSDDQEVMLATRVAKLALISARVGIDPDRLWSDVAPVIRARLLSVYAFEHRRFGQTLHASDVIATIQNVSGVAFVDLTLLSAVAAPADPANLGAALATGGVQDVIAHEARIQGGDGARQILPAEIVFLSDSLPDLLVLNEATS